MLIQDKAMVVLLVVMILSGVVGGLINYLLGRTDDPEHANLLRSLVVGLGASFLVPLFLNMISSNLIAETKVDAYKVLVFAGFCLVAAISSGSFIRTLSDRVLSEAKEAKKVAAEANYKADQVKDDIEEVQTTITEPDSNQSTQSVLPLEDPNIDVSKQLLESIASSKYAYRTLTGISKDTGMTEEEVKAQLDNMVDKSLLGLKLGKNGNQLWYVTENGLKALQRS